MSDNKVHPADVMITYSIGCAKCSVEHEAFTATDEREAAREFTDAGWLEIDGDMTCPKCGAEAGTEASELSAV